MQTNVFFCIFLVKNSNQKSHNVDITKNANKNASNVDYAHN